MEEILLITYDSVSVARGAGTVLIKCIGIEETCSSTNRTWPRLELALHYLLALLYLL
jgi:hypothetical protein